MGKFSYFQLVGDLEENEIMARVAFWALGCAPAIIKYMEHVWRKHGGQICLAMSLCSYYLRKNSGFFRLVS